MIRIKTFFTIVLLILNLQSFAGTDPASVQGTWSLGIKGSNGFILAHRPSLVYLQERRMKSIEVSYLRTTDGKKEWERIYNFPLVGIGYQFFDFGNHRILGNGHALYPLFIFPLMHKRHLSVCVRGGVGIGYVEKAFTLKDNYKNQAIGSRLNCVVTSGIQVRIPSAARTQVNIGFDFTHFSNGSSKLPNLGLNLPALNIGINHFFGKPQTLVHDSLPQKKHGHFFTLYAAGGIKEIYPPEGNKFGIAVLSADYLIRTGRKCMYGGGPDLMYDHTLKYRIISTDSVYLSTLEADVRAGIHGSFGMEFGKVHNIVETGVYLYNRLPSESFLYTRLSIRYYISPKMFACFNLKTHFGKADYFETGLGIQL